MATSIVSSIQPEVNAESRITELHRQAKDIISWLSIPGAAERAGIREPNFYILSFQLLINSCTPEEALDDLETMLDYLKRQAVAA